MCALGKASKSDIRATSCWKGAKSKENLYCRKHHRKKIPGPKYANYKDSAFGNYNLKVRNQKKLKADYTKHVNKHSKIKQLIES